MQENFTNSLTFEVMATKNEKAIEDFSKGFEKDYETIMQNANHALIQQQWSKPGDSFEIFTLYNDNTPVKASFNTVVINT